LPGTSVRLQTQFQSKPLPGVVRGAHGSGDDTDLLIAAPEAGQYFGLSFPG